MSADLRLTRAREYLDGARKRKVTALPPSLLVRECAELRRLLGQLLDIVDEAVISAADDCTGVWLDGSAILTPADLSTVRAAAAEYKRDRADGCPDCANAGDDRCATCEWRLQLTSEYDALAKILGGDGECPRGHGKEGAQ